MTPEGKLFLDALRGAMIAKHFSIEEAIDWLADTEIGGVKPYRPTDAECDDLANDEDCTERGPFNPAYDVMLARRQAGFAYRMLVLQQFSIEGSNRAEDERDEDERDEDERDEDEQKLPELRRKQPTLTLYPR